MNRNRLIIITVLSLLLGLLAFVMRQQSPARIDLPYDINSGGLAAEFATTPIEINEVMGSDRRYTASISQQQYLDFPFIACYVALFVVLGLALRTYDVPGASVLAWIAIVCAIAGGLCDIAENVTILKTMATPSALSSNVRWFSVPKWALAFLVMFIESAVFFFWPRLKLWWRIAAVIVGGLFLFAGASGLLFSLLVSIPDIAWSAAWMSYALFALLLFAAARLVLPGLARAR